jgi:hypothetical protein
MAKFSKTKDVLIPELFIKGFKTCVYNRIGVCFGIILQNLHVHLPKLRKVKSPILKKSSNSYHCVIVIYKYKRNGEDDRSLDFKLFKFPWREENLTYVGTSNFYVSEKDGIRGDKKGVREKGIVLGIFHRIALIWLLQPPSLFRSAARRRQSISSSLTDKIAQRIYIDQFRTSRAFFIQWYVIEVEWIRTGFSLFLLPDAYVLCDLMTEYKSIPWLLKGLQIRALARQAT